MTSDIASSLSATISWGDGSSSSFGTISGSSGSFSVSGSHTYASAGSVTITVTVSNASTGATASTTIAGTVRSPSTITEFTVGDEPRGLVGNSADGKLWFAEYHNIGRLTTTGTFTDFSVASDAYPSAVALNADGTQVWFTERIVSYRVGYMDTFGNVKSRWTIPNASSGAGSIVLGPDGAFWFVLGSDNKITRVTTSGTFKDYSLPTANSLPSGLAVGPDNNLWFGEILNSKVARITTAGAITEWSIPSGAGCDDVTRGPDGNMWFTEGSGSRVGRITMSGVITEFPTQSVNSAPGGIVAGPDGNIWFSEGASGVARIARITPTGALTEFPIPSGNQPGEVAVGPDGNIWFTEPLDDKLGRITP